MIRQRSDIENFLTFFQRIGDPNECWPWNGARNDKGYGQATYQGRVIYAHRLAWIIVYGEIPEGFEICHHCDNPPCVRFNHLFLGTHSDNMQDAGFKGSMARNVKGSKHPLASLDELIVADIRKRYAVGGLTYKDLAAEYGVGWTTIQKIVTRKTWKHV